MAYSIFFSCGLAVGFVAGATIWGLASWIARKKAEHVYKEQLIRLQKEGIIRKQEMEDVKKKMLETYGGGPALSERHKAVLEEELGNVITRRNR